MKRTSRLLTAACALLCAPAVFAAPLYVDDFNTNTAANYVVNQNADTTVQFAYDYSADGIPPAPGSGATTSGVKFTTNGGDQTAAAAAVNISPVGGSFTGDVKLRFWSWLNVNGPFPAGGAGSTQFVTAGVGNGGTTVQSSATGTGPWFGGSNEGGATGDYRAYLATALQADGSAVYAATGAAGTRRESSNTYYHTAIPGVQMAPASQQSAHAQQTGSTAAGSLGFAWHLHEVTKVGNDVSWFINGLRIATFTNPTLSGDNVFVGHWDPFASVTDNPALSFGIIDNVVVTQIPEPATMGLAALALLGAAVLRRRGA
jgi:hypothetical protein